MGETGASGSREGTKEPPVTDCCWLSTEAGEAGVGDHAGGSCAEENTKSAMWKVFRPRVSYTRKSVVIWLILPVVICLSQRLSHACLSISIIR